MNLLLDGYQHNAWANARVFGAAARLTEEQLEEAMPGIYGGVHATARHLVEVEDGFLALITRDATRERLPEMRLDELTDVLANRDQRFIELVTSLDDGALEQRFFIPWFKREARVGDGLLQVLNHSTEHRADLASALTRLGIETPPVDYIMFAIGVAG
jgi:uncharacterized damage-inducible protein DinB